MHEVRTTRPGARSAGTPATPWQSDSLNSRTGGPPTMTVLGHCRAARVYPIGG
jgi:hypothetical protein